MNPQNMIELTIGDDSNALSGDITIEFTTELDLTGFYAIFQLNGLQWKFDDLTAKTVKLVVDREQSALLRPGVHKAGLKVFDATGKCRTVLRDIPVLVSSQVVGNVMRATTVNGGANE